MRIEGTAGGEAGPRDDRNAMYICLGEQARGDPREKVDMTGPATERDQDPGQNR